MISDYFYFFLNGDDSGYIYTLAAFILGCIAVRLFHLYACSYLRRISEKTKSKCDDVILKVFDSISVKLLYLLVFCLSITLFAHIPESFENILKGTQIIILVIIIANCIIAFIGKMLEIWIERNSKSQSIKSLSSVALTVVKIIVWAFAVITILANFGFDITVLIAGIGISGIAVGLATQKILADVFSAFVIFLDKNVLVGDYVQIGSISGTIEKIGIKTTHIRSPSGDEIIVPNEQITSTIVHNNRTLKRRRIVLDIHVNDNTPSDKLEFVPEVIEKAASDLESITLDRCHLEDFGSGYFLYQVVYYEDSDNFKAHKMAVGKFNLSVIKQMSDAEIDVVNPRGMLMQE